MPDRKPWICPQCGRGLPEWESSCDHGKSAAMEAAKVPRPEPAKVTINPYVPFDPHRSVSISPMKTPVPSSVPPWGPAVTISCSDPEKHVTVIKETNYVATKEAKLPGEVLG